MLEHMLFASTFAYRLELHNPGGINFLNVLFYSVLSNIKQACIFGYNGNCAVVFFCGITFIHIKTDFSFL